MPPRPAPLPEPDAWWNRFDPRQRLQAKLTLWVAGATLIACAGSGWTVIRQSRAEAERHASELFAGLASQLADKLDRAIYDQYRVVSLTASHPALRRAETSVEERRRALEAAQDTMPEFAWVGWIGADGRVRAATRRTLEGTDVSVRPWFRLAQGQPALLGLQEVPGLKPAEGSPSGEKPRFLSLAVPLPGAAGEATGVIAAHVHWPSWARAIEASVISETARRDLLGATVYASPTDAILDSGASGWTHPPDAPDLEGARGVRIEDSPGGTRYLSAWIRSRGFRDFRGLGWVTIVRQPLDRVLAPVRRLERAVVAFGLLATLIAAGSTWAVAGRHARRLRSLRASADRIREGDVLAMMPSSRGTDEIDRLSGALGSLVETLRPPEPPPGPKAPDADGGIVRPGYDRPEGTDPRRVKW